MKPRSLTVIITALMLGLAALPAFARIVPGEIDPGFNGGVPAIIDLRNL